MTDLFLPPDVGPASVPAIDVPPAPPPLPPDLGGIDPERPFACDLCEGRFSRLDRLNTHRKAKHPGSEPVKGAQPGKPAADRPPAGVTVNLGGPARGGGKSAELVAVEKRARELAQTMAAFVLLMGQAEDAADLANGAEPWAKSVAGLAEYEPWLRKLAMGGDVTGRGLAWVQFLMATGALCTPILVRHGALPSNMAALAGNVFSNGAALGGTDGPPG